MSDAHALRRRHGWPRRSRQERLDRGPHRHRPGSPAGREGARHHHRSGLCSSGTAIPTSPFVLHVGIVDVPGHEDFVKNMVAGVGSIDLALLVVAADDGWMPQTEEHLQILTYAGVRRAVVALTKADLAADEAAKVAEVRRLLKDSVFAEAPIVPTSVPTARGLDTLKATLAKRSRSAAAAGHRQAPVGRRSRVHVAGDRHRGDGHARRGHAAARPVGRRSTGRPPGTHSPDPVARPRRRRQRPRYQNRAEPGRCGREYGIRRGDVIALPGLGGSSDCLDAMLEISPRAAGP